MKIQLVPPTQRYRESFLHGLREFRHEGLPWWVGGDLETAEQDFAAFVGRISIHHELNDALHIEGGHIGYDTVPSSRDRGVATEMLRQALPVARSLGLTAVLLTCDGTNRPLKRYYWITLS